jgi:ribonuclease HI
LVYRQTNQVAEIIAALNAVRIAMEIQEDVTIVTDSIYVVKSINEWRRQWIASGWKTHLVNKKHLRELSDAVDARLPRKTYFQHVKGHGSCEGNIQADLLATAGAKLDV